MAFALAYKAFPCAVFPFTATKPVSARVFLASRTALVQPETFLYAFLAPPPPSPRGIGSMGL